MIPVIICRMGEQQIDGFSENNNDCRRAAAGV